MARFVRIDKEGTQKTVLLNLDLVATVELSPQSDLLSSGNEQRKVYATFLAHDRSVMATLSFDDASAAGSWVKEQLGITL